MTIEINQPDLSFPDPRDPLRLAFYGKVRSDWLRHVAPQLGLDTDMIVLGSVLNSITQDNISEVHHYNERFAYQNHRRLLERFNWQIDTPELREEIREKLVEAKSLISRFEFPLEIKQEVEASPEMANAEVGYYYPTLAKRNHISISQLELPQKQDDQENWDLMKEAWTDINSSIIEEVEASSTMSNAVKYYLKNITVFHPHYVTFTQSN